MNNAFKDNQIVMIIENETFFKVEIHILITPKIWLFVLKTIKNCDSLKSFKQKIRKWKPDYPCRLCKTYLQNGGFIQ